MPVHVCSLIRDEPQLIPADGNYHIVRFPFTAVGESYDAHGMHQSTQPDGALAAAEDDRAGLIWPALDGWGSLTAMLYWQAGDYTEVRDRFVRDPLNLSTGYNSTATEDHAITPGGQYLHKSHELFVHPNVSLALLVRHNAAEPLAITHAQLKLAIHT